MKERVLRKMLMAAMVMCMAAPLALSAAAVSDDGAASAQPVIVQGAAAGIDHVGEYWYDGTWYSQVYIASEDATISGNTFGGVAITEDCTVIIDGKILNKPRSTADARMMMQLLSGKTHKVITGCCLFYLNRSFCFSEITEVEFYPLTEEEIEEYVITKEPYDKAGGYGIQNKGALFVKGIHGDYYNVVGLPVARLKREIASFLSQDFSAEPTVKESKKKVRLKK